VFGGSGGGCCLPYVLHLFALLLHINGGAVFQSPFNAQGVYGCQHVCLRRFFNALSTRCGCPLTWMLPPACVLLLALVFM
jgi:hypothetical protein